MEIGVHFIGRVLAMFRSIKERACPLHRKLGDSIRTWRHGTKLSLIRQVLIGLFYVSRPFFFFNNGDQILKVLKKIQVVFFFSWEKNRLPK